MKKGYLLVLVTLAVLMILGILVSSQAKVTSGDARYNLEGYSREKGKWTRGVLKGWLEDNWVPYRLSMAKVVPGDFEITIQHDHEWTGSGGPDPGVDVCKSEPGDPLYGEPLFWDEPTSTDFWVGYEDGTPLPIVVTTVKIADLVEPNTIVIQYKSSFSVPSTYGGQNLYLYWMAHLAIGSSEWSGASLHAHTTATGKQDVPIAIPSSNVIYGYKFNDEDADGTWDNVEDGIEGWTIYLEGSYLGENITREVQTNASGCYEFRGLPDGTWTITEEVRTGWVPTTPSTYTVTVHRGQVKGPYNFGNVQLEPDIDVTKVANVEEVHVGDTITYEYTLTNTGNYPLYNVLVVDNNGTPGDTSDDITLYSNGLTKGQVETFTYQRIVTASDTDPLVNVVTAEGYDELGQKVTDSASESVDILRPVIEVTKGANVNEVHVGETITYTIVVKNTGDSSLYNVLVIDDNGTTGDTTDDITLYSDGLTVGQVETFTLYRTVIASDADPLVNVVTAEGYDNLGLKVTDSAFETVNILKPGINVTKVADVDEAHVGDTITYNITVENTGDCPLYSVSVVDDNGTPGDASDDITLYSDGLAVGQIETFTLYRTVTASDADLLVNIVTAEGYDNLGMKVTADDSWSVNILHPVIYIVKSGPEFAHVGDTINYNYTVTNPNDCALSDVTVVDDVAGPATYVSGDTDADGLLDPDETWTFEASYTILSTDLDPLVNNVTASGTDPLGLTVTAEDSWSVDILHPGIDVIKTANATEVHDCDWVEYNVTVVNTGDCSLDVVLNDPLLGISWSGTLGPGQKHEVIVVFHPEDDPTTNTASAVGTDELGGTVQDSDSWTVDILKPSIDVTKVADVEKAHVGDTITYTITVENTGDCPLYNVLVVDDNGTPGDTSDDITLYSDGLAVGQIETFTIYRTVAASDADPLVNIVTAEGYDNLGLKVTDSASESVEILRPAIDIVKTAIPDTIESGDLVTYEYNVTNIGNCVLYNVTVTDDQLGLIGTISTLDVGQTATLTKSTQLFADTTNVGNATGTDELGKEVTASDDAFVNVITPPEHPPSFAFECECVDSILVGQIKTFTFLITNVGDPESRIYYLTFTAVIKDYTMLHFVDPYTAYIKIYYNDDTVWEAYVDGSLTYEKFAGFSPAGDYWMVTWRVPTIYPDGPYLEGNDGGTLSARLEISFQVEGMAGGITSLQMFPRATEDHHINGVPLADINDKANIWGNDLWYPVHNSYDPYDEAIGTGHSWRDGWEPLHTTDQYAQATISILVWGPLTSTTTTATATKTKEY